MSRSAHTVYQERYFADPAAKPRMAPVRTPYVLRHLRATCDAVGLDGGMRVLELGAGRGRFTLLLLERAREVTAIDLSPQLVAELNGRRRRTTEAGLARLELVCGDAAEADRLVEGPFDAVLGFFFLHHLDELGPTLGAARRLVRPGGRVAFCEPNAFCPLFYAQILLTPGMTWRGDGGVSRMRPGVLRRELVAAGFEAPRFERYGLLPPLLANTTLGKRVERWLERLRPLRPLLAFQVISARRPS